MYELTEQKIREIVRDEYRKQSSASRFGIGTVQRHIHNGIDSPQISQDNVLPSVSVSGAITFSSETTYTLNLNSAFTPSRIIAYGNVVGDASQRYFFFGSANLTPSFYFQPLSNTSVQQGTLQQPAVFDTTLGIASPLQSCTYFGAEGATGNLHTVAGEGHIINVRHNEGSGTTTFARATVTTFSKSKIEIVVSNLASGWSINANYVIT